MDVYTCACAWLTKPVPLGELTRVMGTMRGVSLRARGHGDVVIKDVPGLSGDVAIRNVGKIL